MSLSFASFPTGLGYKSSRILGLEEAFIPELRKIEPIPGMSDANRERLERRQRVLDEERRSRFAQEQQHQDESKLVMHFCQLLTLFYFLFKQPRRCSSVGRASFKGPN